MSEPHDDTTSVSLEKGQGFYSFKGLETFLRNYEDTHFAQFVITDSRKLEASSVLVKYKRAAFANKKLIYYSLTYKCIKGRHNRKPCASRSYCPVYVRLTLSKDAKSLVIVQLNLKHTHGLDKDLYNDLPRQKRIAGSVKEKTLELLMRTTNKQMVINYVKMMTGKDVTETHLANLKSTYKKRKKRIERQQAEQDPLQQVSMLYDDYEVDSDESDESDENDDNNENNESDESDENDEIDENKYEPPIEYDEIDEYDETEVNPEYVSHLDYLINENDKNKVTSECKAHLEVLICDDDDSLQHQSDIDKVEAKIKEAIHQKSILTQKIAAWTKQKEELLNKINLQKLEVQSKIDWTGTSFSWSDKIQEILKKTFKLDSFRSQQLAAINATLSKTDVILLMPTGGGKTLTYQLPAIFGDGLTLVVSPLLALIEDQLRALDRLGIYAVAMSPATSAEVKKSTFEYLNKGTGKVPKLVYVTPEFLSRSKRLMAGLQKCAGMGKFDRIAIDEVHCCSQWGHDFRPDYNYLGLLKDIFPNTPILGVTATATNTVLLDIKQMLNINDSIVLRAPFDRPNLNFNVRHKPYKSEEIYEILTELLSKTYRGKSGIIYAGTINDCQEIAKKLRKNNLKVHSYHADLDKEVRSTIHGKWLSNEYQAVVATVAFGMGIDKPDVRFVIHSTIPKSMETLYQEAGRAGRDGLPADHIVLFRLSDYMKISGLTKSTTEIQNVMSVLKYCVNCTDCRHNLLAKAFQQGNPSNRQHCLNTCDNCATPATPTATYDLSPAHRDIYTLISEADLTETKLTLLKLIVAWMKRAKATAKETNQKKGATITSEQAERIIAALIIQGYLGEEKSFTAYTVNCYLRRSKKEVNSRGVVAVLPSKPNLDRYLTRVELEEIVIKGEEEEEEQVSKKRKLT